MSAGYTNRRVVITGVGVVSPIGIGNDSFWSSLMAGETGIDYLQSIPHGGLPSKLAAEITDFDPAKFFENKKQLKVMSRDAQLGVASASLAVRDAKLKKGDIDPERLGVGFGAGRMLTTPQELAEAAEQCSASDDKFEYDRFGNDSMGNICPLWMLRQLPNMVACHISIEHDARGPNNTITSRESSALLALSEAIGVIERGAADCMVVGACSSSIHPVDIARLNLFEALSRRDDNPDRACRPFDFERDGTIVGEGAASFLVEDYDHAITRGADIYAEVLGVGAGCDGKGYSNGAGGTGLVRAIQTALRNSDIEPKELGHINAHGKSTQRDDLVESRAYHRAFGDAGRKIPVTALKSFFGHFDAGSGAVELAGSVLALRHGMIPPTLNYETPDPRCRLKVIHHEPHRQLEPTAISVNRTAMGQSAAAIIRAV
ncbi:MAG: beta-ketoacyl-[acyl-carrier-protein] synthase family protein [Planctomycetaceae bacterium]|nr:beta-ketoacyl-[acyl-carrier-protein] synthase family protein [Planctomycetaceae bacterium]